MLRWNQAKIGHQLAWIAGAFLPCAATNGSQTNARNCVGEGLMGRQPATTGQGATSICLSAGDAHESAADRITVRVLFQRVE
jgi:hypothetical protein